MAFREHEDNYDDVACYWRMMGADQHMMDVLVSVNLEWIERAQVGGRKRGGYRAASRKHSGCAADSGTFPDGLILPPRQGLGGCWNRRCIREVSSTQFVRCLRLRGPSLGTLAWKNNQLLV